MKIPTAGAKLVLALVLLGQATPVAADSSRGFVFCTDYSTGSLDAVDLETRIVSRDLASVNADALVRPYQGLLYVVNRLGVNGDNIQVIDPARGYVTVRQFSVGPGSNPQDIAFVSPTKAYVSRYGSTDLVIVDPSSPSGGGPSFPTISLAGFSDSDGLPEMAHMTVFGGRLFVACERLTNFAAVNPSVVVVVDTQADTVIDVDPATQGVQAIVLAGRNPWTSFELDPVGQRLLIGDAGAFGARDGGIEAIDPVALTSLGFLITETGLEGDVVDVVWGDSRHSYALVSGASDRLVAWDPTAGSVTATLLASSGFSLVDMERNGRGELYVCKRTQPASGEPSGLLVFDAATDALLAGPLDTGLPPAGIAFASVIEAPGNSGATLAEYPNPARGAAVFRIEASGAAVDRLEIYDALGRRVRNLSREASSEGPPGVPWNLKDDHGRPVAAGLYVAKARLRGRTLLRRLVVVRP